MVHQWLLDSHPPTCISIHLLCRPCPSNSIWFYLNDHLKFKAYCIRLPQPFGDLHQPKSEKVGHQLESHPWKMNKIPCCLILHRWTAFKGKNILQWLRSTQFPMLWSNLWGDLVITIAWLWLAISSLKRPQMIPRRVMSYFIHSIECRM